MGKEKWIFFGGVRNNFQIELPCCLEVNEWIHQLSLHYCAQSNGECSALHDVASTSILPTIHKNIVVLDF